MGEPEKEKTYIWEYIVGQFYSPVPDTWKVIGTMEEILEGKDDYLQCETRWFKVRKQNGDLTMIPESRLIEFTEPPSGPRQSMELQDIVMHVYSNDIGLYARRIRNQEQHQIGWFYRYGRL